MVPQAGRRGRAARGAVINSAFFAALGALSLVKIFVVAGFLSTSAFGVWSILFLAAVLVGGIKAALVTDKYIQQDEPDQEAAFQKAFTLELIAAGALAAVMLLLAPVLTVIYGEPELLLPGLALALLLPGLALQFPIAIWYRRMRYLRQRLLMSIDPVVAFVVSVGLAAAGLSYWSLVIGVIVGAWAGGLVALATAPYRLALRYERRNLREYVSYSTPLVIAVVSGLLIGQLSVYFGNLAIGLAAAGAIGLAATFTAYTNRVNAIIMQALYPALCRVSERRDLLFEAFVKSNRLALMWGAPFGVGLALFAADVIEFGIGSRWEDALVVLQVFGVAAALNQVGVNWPAFFKATGETKPIATVGLLMLVAFLVTALPLMLAFGLAGYAASMAIATAVGFAARFHYIGKLFPAFRLVFHTLRAAGPTIAGVAAILAMRAMLGGERTLDDALAELGVYLVVIVAATIALERALITEALSYLRRRPSAQPG